MPIIWPLREKLFTSPVMLQQRPRWTGGRGIPEWPSLPWNEEDRPPQINFGRVDMPPIAAYTLPSNFGLCALRLVSIERKITRVPPYAQVFKYPSVVHELKPLPAKYYSISGVTRDSTGTPLGNCAVHLLYTASDKVADVKTSDANGLYEFRSSAPAVNFYVVAYKAGAPDITGATVNTLVGA